MSKARDIMTASTQFVGTDATVAEAAKSMARNDIGAIPVCGEDKRLRAVITDRDIVVRVIAEGKDPNNTRVGDVTAPTEVVTIGADDSIDEAIRTMKEHKVRRLPVIDGDQVVGMVSQGDLAKHVPDDKVGDLVQAISSAP